LTSDAGDWLELHNTGNIPLDISYWVFKDKNDFHLFTFSSATIIPAHGYLVLCNDMIKFANQFPSVTNKTGPFNFSLGNTGDANRLFDNSGKLYMSVVYDIALPWVQEANGNGYTLELLDSSGHFCDAANWFAGCPGGSPGKKYFTPCDISVNEINNINGISIYPNPASDRLFIETKNLSFGKCEMTISTMMGTIIRKHTLINALTTLDISELAKGVYIIQVTSEKGISVIRFVKE
jgi:hypothetical protein